MDLTTFDAGVSRQEEGIPVSIKGPAGEDTDIIITVACYESERVMSKARALGNKERKRRARNGDVGSVEEDEAKLLDLAVAATVGWSGIEKGGEELACTPDNVRSVYETYGFILEQVQEAGGDRARFFAD